MAVAPARTLSTRMLLLLEIHSRRHARLRTLAKKLDVSVQAVSVVLKRLVKQGLVELRDGAWRPTAPGTEAVQAAVRDLRRFVEDAAGRLRFIEETYAQADRPIRAGARVGLFMREGRLCAAPGVYAGSQGRARHAARRGHLVRVGDLEGIVALKPGAITIITHADPVSAAHARRAKRLLTRTANNGGRLVAAHALPSVVLLEQAGRRPDVEFAPLAAALDAARRGVSVQYWVPEDDAAGCLSFFAEANASSPHRIPVRSVDL